MNNFKVGDIVTPIVRMDYYSCNFGKITFKPEEKYIITSIYGSWLRFFGDEMGVNSTNFKLLQQAERNIKQYGIAKFCKENYR